MRNAQNMKELKTIKKLNKFGPKLGNLGTHPVNTLIAFAEWLVTPISQEEMDEISADTQKSPETFVKWVEENDIKLKNWNPKDELNRDSSVFFDLFEAAREDFKIIDFDKKSPTDISFVLNIKDHKNECLKNLATKFDYNQTHNIQNSILTVYQQRQHSAGENNFAAAFSEMLNFMLKNKSANNAQQLYASMLVFGNSSLSFEELYKTKNLVDLVKEYTKKDGKQESFSQHFASFNDIMFDLGLSNLPGINGEIWNNKLLIKDPQTKKIITKPQPLPKTLPYNPTQVTSILSFLDNWDKKTKDVKNQFWKQFPELNGQNIADLCEYFVNASEFYLNGHTIQWFFDHTKCSRDLLPIGHVSKGQADYWQKVSKLINTIETTKYNNEDQSFKNEFIGITNHIIDLLKRNKLSDGIITFVNNFHDSKNIKENFYNFCLLSFLKEKKNVGIKIRSFKEQANLLKTWIASPEKVKKQIEQENALALKEFKEKAKSASEVFKTI